MVNINVIGRLGADAELINGKNGQFASFRLAVDDRKNSEKTTTWFRVTLNGDRVGKIVEYLTKGKLVNVMGTESVGTYQAKDGSTQVSRDINASNVEFISVGSGSTASDTSAEATTETTTEAVSTGTLKKPVAKTAAASEPEDDLPF
jgi:single-strand DNA-binding protein